jgi:hypothetical protein
MTARLRNPVRYWGNVIASPGLRMSWKNRKSTTRKPAMRVMSSTFLTRRGYDTSRDSSLDWGLLVCAFATMAAATAH